MFGVFGEEEEEEEEFTTEGTEGHGGLIYFGLSKSIIGAAIDVHERLGPGLLESAYNACLAHELMLRGIGFEREAPVRLDYKGQLLDCGYRLDFLVEDRIILEVKAIERFHPIHEAQLLTYLRLTKKRVGLLMNFNVKRLKQGVTRRIL